MVTSRSAAVTANSAAAAVFAYEAVALSSRGRLPTITRLCGKHRWLEVATVGALVVHLRLRVLDVHRGGTPPVVPQAPAAGHRR